MLAQKQLIEDRMRKLNLKRSTIKSAERAGPIRLFCRSTATRSNLPRLGQEGANNLVGWSHNSSRGNDLMIFGFSQLLRKSLEPDFDTSASSSA